MERVEATAGMPGVYVDYAHSPQALDVALRALRVHCKGKLWCVFGCGGDRDTGKRPQMARNAEMRADQIVVTSDNPRGEDPGQIIAQIVDGLKQPDHAIVLEDRAAAIAWAIREASTDDIILIAGKGHENYQIVGTERIDFSDYGAALANLAKRAEGVS
jgi:UDP-N-acetylmuramoyl-L-alanyl-D-glutamate--2,6-diaminopimelate ligase